MLLTMSFFGGWVFDTSFKRPYVQRSSPDRQKGERLVAEGKTKGCIKTKSLGWMGGWVGLQKLITFFTGWVGLQKLITVLG